VDNYDYEHGAQDKSYGCKCDEGYWGDTVVNEAAVCVEQTCEALDADSTPKACEAHATCYDVEDVLGPLCACDVGFFEVDAIHRIRTNETVECKEITCTDSDGDGMDPDCSGGATCHDDGTDGLGIMCKCDIDGYSGKTTTNAPAVCYSTAASVLVFRNLDDSEFNMDSEAHAFFKEAVAAAVRTVMNDNRKLLRESELVWGMRPAPSTAPVNDTDIDNIRASSADEYLTKVHFSIAITGMSVNDFSSYILKSVRSGAMRHQVDTVFRRSSFPHVFFEEEESEAEIEVTPNMYDPNPNSNQAVQVSNSDDDDRNMVIAICVVFAFIIIILGIVLVIVFLQRDTSANKTVAMSSMPMHETVKGTEVLHNL